MGFPLLVYPPCLAYSALPLKLFLNFIFSILEPEDSQQLQILHYRIIDNNSMLIVLPNFVKSRMPIGQSNAHNSIVNRFDLIHFTVNFNDQILYTSNISLKKLTVISAVLEYV